MTGQPLSITRSEESSIESRICWAYRSLDGRKPLKAVRMPLKAAWLPLRSLDVEMREKVRVPA
jgi:hypothetical protein